MLVVQVLLIPLIAFLLVGAIFVIGSASVNRPDYPYKDADLAPLGDEIVLRYKQAPPSLPKQGINY